MPCEHTQPLDVINMAESYLKDINMPQEKWEGFKMGFTENVDTSGHKSIYIEVERKKGQWSVTKLDRRPDPADESDLGQKVL